MVRSSESTRRTHRSIYVVALGRSLRLLIRRPSDNARILHRPSDQSRGDVPPGNLWSRQNRSRARRVSELGSPPTHWSKLGRSQYHPQQRGVGPYTFKINQQSANSSSTYPLLRMVLTSSNNEINNRSDVCASSLRLRRPM